MSDPFDVQLRAPQALLRGTPMSVSVLVLPRAPWHLNVDFPAALQMQGTSGLHLPTRSLQRRDAARYDEGGLVFELPVTIERCGEQTMQGEVHFAVCDDGSCAPSSAPVSMSMVAC